jgi:hypothetical protein
MSREDYAEFLDALNTHRVKYLVVGAHAVSFHSQPRATKDLDILIEPSRANAERVLAAIREFFGGSDLGISAPDLIERSSIIQLGVAPRRIDLLSSLALDVDFEALWERRAVGHYKSVPTQFLSRDDLIAEKRIAARDQDRLDVQALEGVRRLDEDE